MQALHASFRWFHRVYAAEMSRGFWPRNFGAEEVFRIP